MSGSKVVAVIKRDGAQTLGIDVQDFVNYYTSIH